MRSLNNSGHKLQKTHFIWILYCCNMFDTGKCYLGYLMITNYHKSSRKYT